MSHPGGQSGGHSTEAVRQAVTHFQLGGSDRLHIGLLCTAARVAQGGTLRGTISDESGRPLGDVQILLDGSETQTVTTGDGSFELVEIPAGEHRIEARRAGYTAEEIDLVVDGNEPLEVSLQLIWVAVSLDEIEITASHSILREEPGGVGRPEP